MMLSGIVYENMSIAELLYNMRVITSVLERRVYPAPITPPTLSGGADVWRSIPSSVLVPPASPVLPTPVPVEPEGPKACGNSKCSCYYYNDSEEYDSSKIKVDPLELFVHGIDPDVHYKTSRELLIEQLNDAKLRTNSINVQPDKTYAFLRFDRHETAALAQLALAKLGYSVNFRIDSRK